MIGRVSTGQRLIESAVQRASMAHNPSWNLGKISNQQYGPLESLRAPCETIFVHVCARVENEQRIDLVLLS